MQEQEKLQINKNVALLFLFLIFMAVLFVLSTIARGPVGNIFSGIPLLNLFFPLPGLDSPMFFLLPVVGFFLTYSIVDWINAFFETRFALSPWFLLLIFLLSLLALYIAIFWLAAETARFIGKFPEFDFWAELRGSAFYLFLLGSMLGWLSRKIVEVL